MNTERLTEAARITSLENRIDKAGKKLGVQFPKYRELKFNSHEAFDEWLNATACESIMLEDFGQDSVRIHIAESGEILHCSAHCELYNGRFVDLDRLEIGNPLVMDGEVYGKLIIEEISCIHRRTFSKS